MKTNLKKVITVGNAPDAINAAEMEMPPRFGHQQCAKSIVLMGLLGLYRKFPQKRHPLVAQHHHKKIITAAGLFPAPMTSLGCDWVSSGKCWEKSQKEKKTLKHIDALWLTTSPSKECQVA